MSDSTQSEIVTPTHRWLRTGDEAFAAMLGAITAARTSVRLEIYTFTACALGKDFASELVQAARKGVSVKVLVDAFGSYFLSDAFWSELREAGGEVRWFNPLSLKRLPFRNHRKLLVCDKRVAVIGGFNIAEEYQGDGITRGWCDLGLYMEGSVSEDLGASFDRMFAYAEYRHKRFPRLRKSIIQKGLKTGRRFFQFGQIWKKGGDNEQDLRQETTLLLSGPGRGFGSLRRTLRRDLAQAQSAQIVAAYFLPTWRIRHELLRLSRRGGRVQLLLAGKSDVPLSQFACRPLYSPMLRAGIEIYEYQPQILHAKMTILDDLVYIGSANFDVRSLRINYELVLRVQNQRLAAEASEIFEEALSHSRRIDPVSWKTSRSFWSKLKEQWAYILLARVDPYLAQFQLKRLR